MNYEEARAEIERMADTVKKYPEGLQSKVFEVLLSLYTVGSPQMAIPSTSPDTDAEESARKPAERKRQPAHRDTFVMVTGLNLRAQTPSFVEFTKSKAPKSNIEFNTVAVYYLSKIVGVSSITPDHVYTCFKEAKRPLPGNLKSSLNDTCNASRYGYLVADNTRGLILTTRGENLVEHELPRSEA